MDAMDHKTTPQATGEASSNSLAMAILPSLPLLMHSAGDALPEEVSPESTAVLSTFIQKYIASLVGAAIDAHDVFTDGEVVGGGATLGIPSFRPKRQPGNDLEGSTNKKHKIDYWDEPLTHSDGDISSEDDDAPLLKSRRRRSSLISTTSSVNEPPVCTAAVLDIHTSRTRKHYITAPTAMDVRSFIFPICHDAVLYQRVRELQSLRRQLGRDITDDVLISMIREEGEELSRGVGADVYDTVWGTKVTGDGAAIGALVKAGLVDGDGVDATWPDLNVFERDRF